MKNFASGFVLTLAFASVSITLCAAPNTDVTRWQQQANNVTIVRDDWGIAHVHGKTDAAAVFGAIYAQAEDDFNRVETNFINSMGRLAEAEGESKVIQDLRMKLFIDPRNLKSQYSASPSWLQTLMNAWADALNFYLFKHPNVRPRVIKRFEPWMALSFTEGSIGGDIEHVNLNQLQDFYSKNGTPTTAMNVDRDMDTEPSGSNGIAIAPSNTSGHHSLLLINPHTSFFFRSELQMTSDEGLNAYGASTWGQFFIYQGFNDRTGWMHTTSNVDDLDEYLETIVHKGDRLFYKYGGEERPLISEQITIPYTTGHGMAEKHFTIYRTHHGPIIRQVNGKWVSIRIMQEPIKALTQSYSRTKAKDYKSFRQTMELHTNSSNNTIFADADGDIAYFHGNFIPKRDVKFDWTKPVDGSDPATEWGELLSIEDSPNLLNPASGWLYNTNNAPWSAAGASSPRKESYPKYVENGTENARGLHAIRVLRDKKDFTIDSLISAAFDSYLTWFEKPIPALLKAWDDLPSSNPLKAKTADQVAALRKWDLRWGNDSIPTSLAVFWGEAMRPRGYGGPPPSEEAAGASADQMLQALVRASDKLQSDFGTWKTPWGDINRFQRLNDDIASHFDDAGPSIPVPFTSSQWGSLASFGARAYSNTKKWYGTSGNSFVAAVEFGPRVRARAVTAGGESGSPSSPHFNDEAKRYSTGNLREVYFYPDQLKGHTERTYHPGE